MTEKYPTVWTTVTTAKVVSGARRRKPSATAAIADAALLTISSDVFNGSSTAAASAGDTKIQATPRTIGSSQLRTGSIRAKA
ncbi:hypothetical protein GCM10009534_53490 [Kribbella sandramycini]